MKDKQSFVDAYKYKTFEEIYISLKLSDTHNALHLNDGKDTMKLTLNEQYSINVYDNTFETYVEYAKDGRQMTHCHLDFDDTYEELFKCLTNPQACIGWFTEAQQKGQHLARRTYVVTFVFIIILVIFFAYYKISGQNF